MRFEEYERNDHHLIFALEGPTEAAHHALHRQLSFLGGCFLSSLRSRGGVAAFLFFAFFGILVRHLAFFWGGVEAVDVDDEEREEDDDVLAL